MFLAHKLNISEILAWGRKYNLTHVIIPFVVFKLNMHMVIKRRHCLVLVALSCDIA